MRNVIAAVMASTLALVHIAAAEVVTSVNWLPGDEGVQRSSQSHMFDGMFN